VKLKVVYSLKDAYCKNEYTEYARFMVCEALGKENVPIDLYPNNKNRARQIIDKSHAQKQQIYRTY